MPTEHEYTEWADAFEAGQYRAVPIEAPHIDTARLRRGRPPKGAPPDPPADAKAPETPDFG